MRSVTISSFKKNVEAHLIEVSVTESTLLVTDDKEIDNTVVIVPLKKYNSLVETSHLMSSKVNRKRLESSIKRLKSGKAQ